MIADINVTSLVDVTFVLLIVFIIAAPFLRSGIKVELPKAATRQAQPHQAILVSINRAGQAFINNEQTNLVEVGRKVTALLAQSPGLPVLIEGDQKAEYGVVVSVMDRIRQAGVENVGLILETASQDN